MPASSQASSELSTASLTAVRRAFLGLSKPSRCLFFAKNSLTDMSRCFAAIDSAVTARRFGCSPVSLTFGIFVCSSILPDFTLVLPAPPKYAQTPTTNRQFSIVRRPYRWVRHPWYLAAIMLFRSCVDFTSGRLLFNLWTDWVCLGVNSGPKSSASTRLVFQMKDADPIVDITQMRVSRKSPLIGWDAT